MRAIMLAAGVGARLYGEGHNMPPKCLLRFEGKTLLQRHVEILQGLGIEELALVVGYRKEDIIAELQVLGAAAYTRIIENERYTLGPIISLWTAREEMRRGDDVLFMDADVLYPPVLLRRLVRSRFENCFLVDDNFEDGDEPVRVCIRDGIAVDFGKKIEGDFDTVGEWPGFLRMSPRIAERMAAETEAFVDAGRLDAIYEEAMRNVLKSEPPGTFGFENITGLPWIEIDFPEDLSQAQRRVMPDIAEADAEADAEAEADAKVS